MFSDWALKLAAKEVEALTKLGLADEFVSAMTKINKIVHPDFKSYKAFKSLYNWLTSQSKKQALDDVDEWANLMITFFLTINVPKRTEKTTEEIKSPVFKKGLVNYIKKHSTLCYALFTGGSIGTADSKELSKLIDKSGKEIGLTPEESSSVKTAAVAGTTVIVVALLMGICIIASYTIISSIPVIEHALDVIKDVATTITPKVAAIPWPVWAVLIIGIGITALGIGWSKIRPKTKK